MKRRRGPSALIGVLIFWVVQYASAQDAPAGQNPLAVLKAEAERVLKAAELPFTEEQDKAIVLMMEDRRQASEELFGNLFDFRGGPTQGQDADRLRSAIEWMSNEFSTRLRAILTAEQLAVWTQIQNQAAAGGTATEGGGRSAAGAVRSQNQTQYVRINNNSFTAEDASFRFGRNTNSGQARTEVIQRGGSGAFHGNLEFLFGIDTSAGADL